MNICKTPKPRHRVDLAPLVDVVFLLLVFFMLTFVVQGQGMDVEFPQGQAEADQNFSPLVITLSADETLKLGDHVYSADALLDRLKQEMVLRRDKDVVIKVSPKSRYQAFARLLDITRRAGVKDYAIAI